MGRRLIEVDPPVSVAAAWRDDVEPTRWSAWAPHITSVSYPQVTLRPRTSGVGHGPVGPRLPFPIVEVRPPGWSWVVAASQVRIQLDHDLAQRADRLGASRALPTMPGPTPVLMAYAPLARHALTRLGRGGR